MRIMTLVNSNLKALEKQVNEACDEYYVKNVDVKAVLDRKCVNSYIYRFIAVLTLE